MVSLSLVKKYRMLFTSSHERRTNNKFGVPMTEWGLRIFSLSQARDKM